MCIRDSNNITTGINEVTRQIEADLSDALGCVVDVTFHYDDDIDLPDKAVKGHFVRLENLIDLETIEFTHYEVDPNILEHAPMLGFMPFQVTSSALRSNCRITNQPDWGDVFIHIQGEDCVTPESLMRYIISMRKENHFHEEICEMIFAHLTERFEPEQLMVSCLYTRRGGIDINPIRATHSYLIPEFFTSPDFTIRKTLRQ